MAEDIRTVIPVERVRSLCWDRDELVDWVDGGKRFHLNGSIEDSCVRYGYRFDAACVSPSGSYAVIYERLGTKALLL
jgi:hypothetical protein